MYNNAIDKLKFILSSRELKAPFIPSMEAEEALVFTKKTNTPYITMDLEDFATIRAINNEHLTSLCKYLPKGAYIAGGFMTSFVQKDDKATDIDIFFNSSKALEETVNLIKEPPKEKEAWAWKDYELLCGSDEDGAKDLQYIQYDHVTAPSIQLIKLVWYEDPTHVIDTFDFTICQIVTDGKNISFNSRGLSDLNEKKLNLHRVYFPEKIERRHWKYRSKGYTPSPGIYEQIKQIRYVE